MSSISVFGLMLYPSHGGQVIACRFSMQLGKIRLDTIVLIEIEKMESWKPRQTETFEMIESDERKPIGIIWVREMYSGDTAEISNDRVLSIRKEKVSDVSLG